MAFGISRVELKQWKEKVKAGEIAFLTHFWLDERFPNCTTVTKVGCANVKKLKEWGKKYDLQAEWIHHHKKYPHFDLLGERQRFILKQEGKKDQLRKLEK